MSLPSSARAAPEVDPRLGTLVESNRYMLEKQQSCNVVFRAKAGAQNGVTSVGTGNGLPSNNNVPQVASSNVSNNAQNAAQQQPPAGVTGPVAADSANPNVTVAEVHQNQQQPSPAAEQPVRTTGSARAPANRDPAIAQARPASNSAVGSGAASSTTVPRATVEPVTVPNGTADRNSVGRVEERGNPAEPPVTGNGTQGNQNSDPLNRGLTDINERLLFSPTGFYEGSEYTGAHMYVLRARCPKLADEATKLPASTGAVEDETYEIELEDITPKAFYEVLRFLYYEKIRLTPENCFSILRFSRRYNVPLLTHTTDQYILRRIASNTVCEILSNGIEMKDTKVIDRCTEYISKNTLKVLQSETFLSASADVVDLITSQEYLGVEEFYLLDYCISWAKHKVKKEQGIQDLDSVTGEQLKKELNLILSNKRIRFPTMSIQEFSQSVVPLGILDSDDIVDVYNYIALSSASASNKPSSKFTCTKRHLTVPSEEVENIRRTQTPRNMPSTVYRSMFISW